MIRRFINSILTIVVVCGSAKLAHHLYIHDRENLYIVGAWIAGMTILLYLTGEFDDFIDNTLDPELQKLLKWFNRRNSN